jgi:uncharacterized protein YbaP (TraB family)
MVERFNGRISDVLKTHHFNSSLDLQQTLLRYVTLYNHQFPQSALKSKTPVQSMKDWFSSHPHLFNKRPYDRAGCDNYLEATVFKRNASQAEKVDALLRSDAQKPVFFALGALHLVGDGGVPARLAKKGYSVQRLCSD